jgi:hypothetical protein
MIKQLAALQPLSLQHIGCRQKQQQFQIIVAAHLAQKDYSTTRRGSGNYGKILEIQYARQQ